MTTLSKWGDALLGSYPDPNAWSGFEELPKRDVFRFARLWLTEGIPYAFKDRPILYELGREVLARGLSDNPKHISLTGSGRIGFSLSEKKFGRGFKSSSDLDLFIISPPLFERLANDARLFVARFVSGLAVPRNETQAMNWANNAKELPSRIERGFIENWRVPLYSRYEAFMDVSRSLTSFLSTVNAHLDRDKSINKVSLRCYRDWDRAVAQIGGSLVRTLTALGHRVE